MPLTIYLPIVSMIDGTVGRLLAWELTEVDSSWGAG